MVRVLIVLAENEKDRDAHANDNTLEQIRTFKTTTGDVSGHAIELEVWQQALTSVGCDEVAAAQLGHETYWAHRNGIFYLYDETLEVLQQIHGRLPMAIIIRWMARPD